MGAADSREAEAARQQQCLLGAVVKGDKDAALAALKAGANVNSALVIFQGTWKRLNKKLLHVGSSSRLRILRMFSLDTI